MPVFPLPFEEVKIRTPNGGELWKRASNHMIYWSPGSFGKVRIDLMSNGSVISAIATDIPNTGSYDWAIPANQPPGFGYRIRITSLAQPSVTHTSMADFTIPRDVVANHGTWNTTTTPASWITEGNWVGSVIADGSGNTADFSRVNITADTTVTLDDDRTIGNLIFGDTATGTAGSWSLDTGITRNTLTLAGATPTITVNALGTNKTTVINTGLSGTSGFTKNGIGTLLLNGGTSSSLSGSITVSAGTLGSLNSVSLQNITGPITVTSGATFDAKAAFGGEPIANRFVLSGSGSGGQYGALHIRENAYLTGAITLNANTLITHDWNVASVRGSITGTNANLELKTLQTSQPGFFMYGPINLGTGSLKLTGIGTVQSADSDFSGTLSYTGETIITSGTMRLSGTARLPDSTTVRIASGAVLNLDFAGTDTVAGLYIGGLQKQPGTYGSLASTAVNKSADFRGSGILFSAPSYYDWAATNAGGKTPDLDFDNDGMSNGVEYFMGETGSSFTPNPSLSGRKVTWPKNPTALATYIVQTSINLRDEVVPGDGGWAPAASGVVDNGTSVEYTLPAGDPKRFTRLKVTVTP